MSFASKTVLRTVELSAPEPWHAYLLPLDSLPLNRASRPWLRNTTAKLVEQLRKESPLQHSVWLLLDELHKENAVQEISLNAQSWKPDLGLGVRPEGPPPRYRTKADFLDRDYGSPIPNFMHLVMHLDADECSSRHACDVMVGTGGLTEVLHAKPVAEIRADWYDQIQPTIREEGLAAYPLYFPLLSTKSLGNDTSDVLAGWMSNIEAYIRESAEDNGVLVLAKRPLRSYLESVRLS